MYSFSSYGLETAFAVVKELAAIAGISPLDKDTVADFFASPHDCPFTQTRDHHGNHPVVAASLSDFIKSVEQMISVDGIKWSGLEQQLLPATAESAISVLQGGHQERLHWSYATITSSDAPAQVNSRVQLAQLINLFFAPYFFVFSIRYWWVVLSVVKRQAISRSLTALPASPSSPPRCYQQCRNKAPPTLPSTWTH